MWLGSFRRQGMLAHWPAPDPKWKLIISSFFILPYLLDFLICTRNVIPILLLLEIMGRWDRYRDGWLKIGCRWGDSSWASSYHFFFFCHVLLQFFPLNSLCLYLGGLWWLLSLFLYFYFFSIFVSSPFNLHLLVHRNCFFFCVKVFSKWGNWSIFCGVSWIMESVLISITLQGVSTLLYTSWDF